MGKIKLIALLTLATSVVILIIIFFKFPGLLENFANKQEANVPKQTTSESFIPEPEGLVDGVKNFVTEKSKQTTGAVAQVIDDKTKAVAKQILGENTEAVVVSIPASAQSSMQSSAQDIIVFDLSNTDKIIIKLKKSAKYYIQFKNVQANTCFYINETKYEIESGKILQLEFQKTGNYTLSTNSCDLKFREVGSFAVDE